MLARAFLFGALVKIHPGKLFAVDTNQPIQSCGAGLNPFGGQSCIGQSLPDDRHLHQTVTQQTTQKTDILFSARHQFGNSQIMNFQTKAGPPASVLVVHRHKTFTPSGRQYGGFLTDPMCVVAECLMKGRAFANGTINQIIICRVAQREHIGFNGDQQFIRCLWELSQHRLTADDDKFRCAGDAGDGPDDMFKLLPVHDGSWI